MNDTKLQLNTFKTNYYYAQPSKLFAVLLNEYIIGPN